MRGFTPQTLTFAATWLGRWTKSGPPPNHKAVRTIGPVKSCRGICSVPAGPPLYATGLDWPARPQSIQMPYCLPAISSPKLETALVGAEWRGCCVIVGYPGVRVVGLVEGDVVRDAAYKTVSKSLSVGVSQNPFGVTPVSLPCVHALSSLISVIVDFAPLFFKRRQNRKQRCL